MTPTPLISQVWQRWRTQPTSISAANPYAAIKNPTRAGGVRYTPAILDAIVSMLRDLDFDLREYEVDVAAYRQYVAAAGYAERYPDYYAFNLPEKSLEHYISAALLGLSSDDVYVDVASEGSPVPEVYRRLYGCQTFRQDVTYPPGVNGDTIGGDAADLPVPAGFASKMALHCSFEHFEGDADVRFIRELSRVLRPGGAVCIVPLYLFDTYAIQTDPAVSVPAGVAFEPDAVVYCDITWKNRHGRFYDPAHLWQRVRNNLSDLQLTIYRIVNAKAVDASCYVEFAALITRSTRC